MEVNIFEEATRKGLRFATSKGLVTTEDLWDLKLDALDTLAKNLDKEVKESSETSFVKKKSSANKTAKLKFDVVLHVINTKLAEEEAATLASEKKAKKQQLLNLIAQKENEELSGKSLAELKAMVEAD